MAKKTAKPKKNAPKKNAKPRQAGAFREEDVRRVVDMVLAEMSGRPRWTIGCYPPMNLAKHVVRQDEVLGLLDYFIKVATSTRQAISLYKNGGWTVGCEGDVG